MLLPRDEQLLWPCIFSQTFWCQLKKKKNQACKELKVVVFRSLTEDYRLRPRA